MKKITTLLFYVFASFSLLAQPGTIDNSFGQNGFVNTAVTGIHSFPGATIVQDDGKIIVVGFAGESATYKSTVVRYNTDGTLDTGFGNNGKLIIPVGNAISHASDVALQADGKIVIAAYTWNNSVSEFAAIRLNPNGTLDYSFGNQGVKIFTKTGTAMTASIRIQDDGKILLAGFFNEDFALLRMENDGTLDTSFGVNGWSMIEFTNATAHINEIEIQSDGKIVLGGNLMNDVQIKEMAVARLNIDGTLDNTFGNQGKLRFNIGYGHDNLSGLVIQNDGKIILGGHKWIDNNELKFDFALVRLNSDGSFDPNYGNNGVVTTQIVDGTNVSSGILLQENQKLLMVGTTVKSNVYKFALLRFDTNGSLDSSFGNSGVVSFDYEGNESHGKDLDLQPDGKIMMLGHSFTSPTTIEMISMRFENDDIVGLKNYSKGSLKLYPNPSKDFISIELEESSEQLQLEVSDIMGRVVYENHLKNSLNIDVSNFKSGTYFVKVIGNNRSEVIKFVKK